MSPVVVQLYGHFGPRTLPPQDTSAPIFGAEVSRTLRHRRRSVGAAGQQQAYRTQTCPCGPTCSGPCPAASPHYASCAAFVGRRHKRYYCRWSSRCMVLSRLDCYTTLAGLPGNQIDRLVCDERRCTTCLLCTEVRAYYPAARYSVTFTGCGCQSA